MGDSTRWLHRYPCAERKPLRLYCFSHAGGGATSFHSWSGVLPRPIQVCPVLLPGRETRTAEAPFTRIDELLDAVSRELTPELDSPYAVFGHSMGALIAFEWIRRVQNQNRPLPAWLFLSGRSAPQAQPDLPPIHGLPDNEFLAELMVRYEGVSQQLLQDPELIAFYLPILRADLSLVESYRFEPGEQLDCPIAAFAGIGDPSVNWNRMFAWKAHTTRRFTIQFFPGGHFYPQAPLLQSISAALSEAANL